MGYDLKVIELRRIMLRNVFLSFDGNSYGVDVNSCTNDDNGNQLTANLE